MPNQNETGTNKSPRRSAQSGQSATSKYDKELASMTQELQSMQKELQELRTMAQSLSNQENQNYLQSQYIANQQKDLIQMAAGEKNAAMLLQQIQQLCDQMNQHVMSVSSHIGMASQQAPMIQYYQPELSVHQQYHPGMAFPQQNQPGIPANQFYQPAPTFNGGMPNQSVDYNLQYRPDTQFRPDTQYQTYPYNRSTT